MFNIFKDKEDLVKMVALLEEKVDSLEEENEKLKKSCSNGVSYAEVAKDFQLPKDMAEMVIDKIVNDIEPLMKEHFMHSLFDVARATKKEYDQFRPYASVAYETMSDVYDVRVSIPQINTNVKVVSTRRFY